MFSWLYVTTPNADEAASIARTIVGERLAACANVFPTMSSFYWWDGEVQQDSESVLILKTRTELVPTVTERVGALHSYSCPCVVALPITAGNPAYLEWLAAETTEPTPG